MSVTKDNNYVLKDVLGVQIEQSIPLHKLKITSLEESEPFYEIHRIVSHKKVNGKIQYLVQWKDANGKKFNNSWVKPEDFVSMKFVNDYHNTINQRNQRNTRSKTAMMSNFVMVLFLSLLLFPVAFSQVKLAINDEFDFDFCELKDDMVPIDLNDLCSKKSEGGENSLIKNWLLKYYGTKYFASKSNFSNNQPSENINHFQAGILSKSINKVSGKAYQCKKLSLIRSWSVGFWGKKYRNDEIKVETLDADSCWYMVRNKSVIKI